LASILEIKLTHICKSSILRFVKRFKGWALEITLIRKYFQSAARLLNQCPQHQARN
jgi:hypothetical protein